MARAAVCGVPDDVLGEVGVAVVVAAPGATPDLDVLRAHCSGMLADYKAPDALVVVDELPLTPMMKVDPVRLGALAEGAAARRRRQARQESSGKARRVLGSEPSRTADDKERA